MASGSKITDTVRRVFRFRVRREGELVTMTVAADGFLYNMVRIMAGTLLCPGVTAEKITRILDARGTGRRRQRRRTGCISAAFFTRRPFDAARLYDTERTGNRWAFSIFREPGKKSDPAKVKNPLEGSIL